jgi:hypothetical protein
MRRSIAVVLMVSMSGCFGGDNTPLPPLAIGPQWMPIMLDTTGNVVMRRMGIWLDTANVTTSPLGYSQTRQMMQMDMKIGGMSTNMQMRMEIDCAGQRMRTVGMDSLRATVKGQVVDDATAKQAMAQQSGKISDTTWRSIGSEGTSAPMLGAICSKTVAGVTDSAAKAQPAPAPAAPTKKK